MRSGGDSSLRSGELVGVLGINDVAKLVELRAAEAHYAVAPEPLRDVERIVCRFHQRLAVSDARMREGCDATADRPTKGAALKAEGVRLHLLTSPFGERHRGVEHRSREQDDELLSAVPPHLVDLA